MNRISIGLDNGLSPVRRQAVIWTNSGLLSIGRLRTNFSEIWIGILPFSFWKIHLKMSSAKMPFCPVGDELTNRINVVTSSSRRLFWCFLFSRPVLKYDDVIKRKHFPRYWTLVRGIHRSAVNSPHKDQWRGALIVSLICAWMNGWVNNREVGDLRRQHAHYDVTVTMAVCTVCTVILLRFTQYLFTGISFCRNPNCAALWWRPWRQGT